MFEQPSPTQAARGGPARAVLHRAILERETAKKRLRYAREAEQYGRELRRAAERVLAAFSDVNLAIVQHRAEAFKRAIEDATRSDSGLPDDLAARSSMRDRAVAHVHAAKAEHERLLADLGEAERSVKLAAQHVAVAAVGIMIAEAAEELTALRTMWHDVWREYDRLSALADCWLQYEGRTFPITFSPDSAKLLQAIAALDQRRFAGGHNQFAARAGELWCRWFEALLTNAEARPECISGDSTPKPSSA